ncbi:hypothetical protein C8R44DRAFT_724622 [Mycena epipterygia]|nr:hypothetical protein C8R44DRAFT_724622 [Mycena epipterygia]
MYPPPKNFEKTTTSGGGWVEPEARGWRWNAEGEASIRGNAESALPSQSSNTDIECTGGWTWVGIEEGELMRGIAEEGEKRSVMRLKYVGQIAISGGAVVKLDEAVGKDPRPQSSGNVADCLSLLETRIKGVRRAGEEMLAGYPISTVVIEAGF